MPKRIAVIDIGSNSARLVIFQRTSRYGFHLVCQQKSRVRIGEGAYNHGGTLQAAGIRRAYGALYSFTHTLKEYRVRKVHCVATSALRDAPNRYDFIRMVRKRLGLNIRIIDGGREAFYGAVAAINLLPAFHEGITIDIGGGSTELAFIRDRKIIRTFSLELGTVRLKELFTDRNAPEEQIRRYIRTKLEKIPEAFLGRTAIAIGGTARALSRGIMLRHSYPFDKIHAFEYSVSTNMEYLLSVIRSETDRLGSLNIKKNRHDTIREGTHIFIELLQHLHIEKVITSGAGVREGVFLYDLLRNDSGRFPPFVNPSLRSIRDRFDMLHLPEGNKQTIGRRLFETLKTSFDDENDGDNRKLLSHALSLSNIGKTLTIYKEHQHAFYIAMQELNFGFTHRQILLIALLLRSKGDSLYYKPLYRRYKDLFSSKRLVKWLSFIYTLTLILHENSSKADIAFEFEAKSNLLVIRSDRPLYLAHEDICNMQKPDGLTILLLDDWETTSGQCV